MERARAALSTPLPPDKCLLVGPKEGRAQSYCVREGRRGGIATATVLAPVKGVPTILHREQQMDVGSTEGSSHNFEKGVERGPEKSEKNARSTHGRDWIVVRGRNVSCWNPQQGGESGRRLCLISHALLCFALHNHTRPCAIPAVNAPPSCCRHNASGSATMGKRKRTKAPPTTDEAELNFRNEQRGHLNQNAGRGNILIPMVCI